VGTTSMWPIPISELPLKSAPKLGDARLTRDYASHPLDIVSQFREVSPNVT
jgi:hypothetical protein